MKQWGSGESYIKLCLVQILVNDLFQGLVAHDQLAPAIRDAPLYGLGEHARVAYMLKLMP